MTQMKNKSIKNYRTVYKCQSQRIVCVKMTWSLEFINFSNKQVNSIIQWLKFGWNNIKKSIFDKKTNKRNNQIHKKTFQVTI